MAAPFFHGSIPIRRAFAKLPSFIVMLSLCDINYVTENKIAELDRRYCVDIMAEINRNQ